MKVGDLMYTKNAVYIGKVVAIGTTHSVNKKPSTWFEVQLAGTKMTVRYKGSSSKDYAFLSSTVFERTNSVKDYYYNPVDPVEERLKKIKAELENEKENNNKIFT